MSTNRLTTRAKNTTQRPGLLLPKQTRRTSDEVAAIRKAKEDAKKEKEVAKTAGIKRVAKFEQNQADKDAMERTPPVVMKPNPLVRTRSYADVLQCNDVKMIDVQVTEPGTPFESAIDEAGQTTDDGMETAIQDSPQKKVRFFFFFSPICQLIRQRLKQRKMRKNLGYGILSRRSRIFRKKILNARNLSSPVIASRWRRILHQSHPRRIPSRGLLSPMTIYRLPPSM